MGCFNGNDMHFITFWMILAHLYIATALAKFIHSWIISIITIWMTLVHV